MSISVLFTIVPEEGVPIVYPQELLGPIQIISTLTGFAPSLPITIRNKVEKSSRPVDIGYRGRELSSQYGELGRLKGEVGERFAILAADSGLVCDLSRRNDDRLYGVAWLEFLSNCKAVLGTPSASNLWPNAPWIFGNTGTEEDLGFSMEMVSPRIFEAIVTRTALILLEGEYSGVVEPGKHYFPMARDLSNFDEVVRFLRNPTAIGDQVDRAYDHVIGSGMYSYERFMSQVDEVITHQLDGFFRPSRFSTHFEIPWDRKKLSPIGGQIVVPDLAKPFEGPPLPLYRSLFVFLATAPFRVLRSLARATLEAVLRKTRLSREKA